MSKRDTGVEEIERHPTSSVQLASKIVAAGEGPYASCRKPNASAVTLREWELRFVGDVVMVIVGMTTGIGYRVDLWPEVFAASFEGFGLG